MKRLPKIVLLCGLLVLAAVNALEAFLRHFKGVRHALSPDQVYVNNVTPSHADQAVAVIDQNEKETGRVVVFIRNRYIERFIRDRAVTNLWIVGTTLALWLASEAMRHRKNPSEATREPEPKTSGLDS